MAKVKKEFVCQQCGTRYAKWQGRCNACGEWNTIEEELVEKRTSTAAFSKRRNEGTSTPVKLDAIPDDPDKRRQLKDAELNRVLGGGLVDGSVVLIGGEPGIGKSTLMLQLALENELKVLYVSGEESLRQIRMRAERVGSRNEDCYLLADTLLENILRQSEEVNPDILIIDSVQTLQSGNIEAAPGTITQIRECTTDVIRYAKESGTPVFLIGHITKDGNIAGPKVLEHMVDTVLQFEGDRNHVFRILRANKNRFGSTNEIGIYEMVSGGLVQVENPSEVLVSGTADELSGVAVACSMEGMRPLMIEVQALVSLSAYGTPQRTSTGFDLRRLNMLLAVLEKRCGVKLGNRDVFLNITGGIRVDDPGIDLAVIAAVLSSQAEVAVHKKVCFAAEVGLSGEIRPVQRVEQRIREAARLGYERIVVSRYTKGLSEINEQIEIVGCSKLDEAFRQLF